MTPHATNNQTPHKSRAPLWLSLFCYALMGPACAINGAFIAISIPAMASTGYTGLYLAAAIGALVGVLPARWMARKIHEGIADDG